jgi:hypothetical protein
MIKIIGSGGRELDLTLNETVRRQIDIIDPARVESGGTARFGITPHLPTQSGWARFLPDSHRITALFPKAGEMERAV